MQLALGLIETKGLIGAIEAADAMAKAADVKIINKEKSTAALVTIKIEGEVAAVKSAVDAGAAAAQRIGQLLTAHVIPRPHNDIDFIISQTEKVSSPVPAEKKAETKKQDKPVKETVVKKSKAVKLDESEDQEEFFSEQAEGKDTEELKEDSRTESTDLETDDAVSGTITDTEVEEEFIPETPDENEKQDKSHLDRLREEARSEIAPEMEEEEKGRNDIPPMEELEKMNVHALRKLARSIDSFPIKGREISKANRQTLLDYLKAYV